MKKVITIFIVLISISNTVTQKIKITVENSVVKSYFINTKLTPTAIENNASGFASVRFSVNDKGLVSNIENVFAEDTLLLEGI